jgi:hypothetical protein
MKKEEIVAKLKKKKHDLPFSGWIANELSHTDCPIPPYLCILQASKQQTLLIMAPPHSTTTTTIWQAGAMMKKRRRTQLMRKISPSSER